MALFEATPEQKHVVDLVKRKHHVAVEACAGAGKTATILHICKEMPARKVLVLTYNNRLRSETRKDAARFGISNVTVHTFHSFSHNNWGPTRNDVELAAHLKTHKCSAKHDEHIIDSDLIIVDEAQDCTPLYAELISFLVKHSNAQIVIMGDTRQCINQFNGADVKYFHSAHSWLPRAESEWRHAKLSVTQRLPREGASFVDQCLLDGNKDIVSCREGSKPSYVICDAYGNTPFKIIMEWLQQGYMVNDIMILAPSLRANNSPAHAIQMRLVANGIPCYECIQEDSVGSEKATHNKILFSTYHAAKGLTRKCVLWFGADASFFDLYDKTAPENVCPNVMYVAATRHKEQLAIIHHYKHEFLPFLKRDLIKTYTNFQGNVAVRPQVFKKDGANVKPREISVTRLLTYATDVCIDNLKVNIIRPPKDGVERVPTEVPSKVPGSTEEVADITGLACTMWMELQVMKNNSMVRNVSKLGGSMWSFDDTSKIAKLAKHNPSINDVLWLTTIYQCSSTGYPSRAHQIKEFNWLTSERANMMVRFLQSCVEQSTDLSFETSARRIIEVDGRSYSLFGRIDVETPDHIVEVKATQDLTNEHVLQLALYGWLLGKENPKRLLLVNVQTEEVRELIYDYDELDKIARTLLGEWINAITIQETDSVE